VNGIPPKDRDVAVVFQNYALYPHMTVYDNIAFPLKMRKLSKGEVKDKVIKISQMLGISELLKRKPRELSGGQMQRVALGRALVREPKLFLLDEPLSNLDSKLRIQMRSEIKKLQKRVGVTTIYITHDQTEAMGMADKIVILNEGIIQQVGTPEEVYKKPQNIFVANFIGNPQINILNFEIIRKEDGRLISLESENMSINIPKIWYDVLSSFGESIKRISLGIRPKDIFLADYSDSNSMHFKGELCFVEMLGDETIYEFKLENNSIIHVSNLSVDSSLKNGSKLVLETKYEDILLFNADTGIRIL
jgi:multiple sugar transport system ATP-binding protein